MVETPAASLHIGWLLAYLFFIVYGSLVPLDFEPKSLEFAWQQFQQMQMLKLGIESRADWIANGVLFVPAGFLLAERLVGRLSGPLLGIAAILVVAFSALLACGIEFAQLFFPPRTVSQNDIFAEIIGATIGTGLALTSSIGLRRVVSFRPTDGQAGITRLLVAYMATYLAYSLFPFDFLLDASEISAKANSDMWGWLFAGKLQDGVSAKLLWLGIETGTAMPFGIYLARLDPRRSASPLARLITGGLLLGLCIESAQFFLYHGISQGASVASRTLGVWVGAFLWTRAGHLGPRDFRKALRRYSLPLGLAYLVGVAVVAGWFQRSWGQGNDALAALQELQFIPFYYHYHTSEAHALASLLSVAATFLPIGIFAWAWDRSASVSVAAAASLATVIEASKLFFSGTHADPTNILIAASAAWTVTHWLGRLDAPETAASSRGPSEVAPSTSNAAPAPSRNPLIAGEPATFRGILWLLTIAVLCSIWLASFPLKSLPLAAVFIVSGLAVWFAPISAMAIIPAALPVFDLAPWSGRFYLDEFDALLALTLCVGYVRTRGKRIVDNSPSAKLLNAAVGLLAVSFAVSTIRALLPLNSPDINSFATYFSQFNALRIGKGLFWAMAFVGFARRLQLTSAQVLSWFAWGIALGLAATVGIIAREKFLFGGLLNFSSDYRATGPFSAIHTGGAYIECYLAVAAPFLILLLVRTNNWIQRLAGAALLLASTYALMATVSRNGFAAYAVACSLALLATLSAGGGKIRRIVIAAALAAAMLAVAVPMFEGDFTQQRMSQVGHDLDVRKAHWQSGLAMRDNDIMTELFGMGVGRYPEIHYWRSREKNSRTSAHGLGVEENNAFLRIVPGNTVYVEQIVDVAPRQKYRLGLDVRSSTVGAAAGIALCEKWMLASSRCAAWQGSPRISQPGRWQHFEQTIDSGELGSGAGLARRPIKLSFFTNWKGAIDIDNIRLTKSNGSEILGNGDFSHGMDRWYFATDEHLAWHIKSMPMAILFDLGWLGILAFGCFLGTALYRVGRATWSGDVISGAMLAAICGFLVVAIFDTLIDAPRFLFLLVTLALLTGLRANPLDCRQR